MLHRSGDSREFQIWRQAGSQRYVGVVMGIHPLCWWYFDVAMAPARDWPLKVADIKESSEINMFWEYLAQEEGRDYWYNVCA